MLNSNQRQVFAGVDTHGQTHHVAVIDQLGRELGDQEFPTTSSGYARLLNFMLSFGWLVRVGVEGTASYGATLTAFLRSQQITVREVIRPNRAERRRGKSDPIDAYAAARATAANQDLPIPKLVGGQVDGIRGLLRVRGSAVKATTAAINQIKALLVTADPVIREAYEPLGNQQLIAKLASTRPKVDEPVKTALRRLARRVQYLMEESDEAEAELHAMVEDIAPALLNSHGVGVVSAAQLLVTAGENPERITSKAAFAGLVGVSPIPASSGKTTRYRLNRGGDRQANAALHRIALVRMSSEDRTRRYIAKKRAEGHSTREAMRCVKRYIANEIYTLITKPTEVPQVDDLRPLREQKQISLQLAAQHLAVWPTKLSRIERGISRDDRFAASYRDYLLAA